MDDENQLIYVNALVKDLELLAKHKDSFLQSVILGVVQTVKAQPTVDAVEVVRCRECRRCFKHTTKRNRQKMWICMRNDLDVCVRPDDFCSYGERKDGDDNG